MKDISGPVKDKKAGLIWKVATLAGGIMALVAILTWPWVFVRRRRQVDRQRTTPTAKERALKALQEARESCFNYEDHRKRLFFEINRILRNYLKEVDGLSTANRPSMEIMGQFKDRPFYDELKGLAGRVNQVIYEGDAPVDVESIVRQFSGLLEKIDGTTAPGVEHDKAG